MLRRLAALWRDESGPTAVEYALMAVGVAGLIVAVVIVFGQKVNATFDSFGTRYP
jgi:Flp pilus assembly pilin Flp